MESGQNFLEGLKQLLTRIKKGRRLTNLYQPPTKHFDCLIAEVFGNHGSQTIKRLIYEDLFAKLKDWEQVELFSLNAFKQSDYSWLEKEGVSALKIMDIIYLFDYNHLFEVYEIAQFECVAERFELLAIDQFKKTTRHAIQTQLRLA